jgi:catecholate siderophore receptor
MKQRKTKKTSWPVAYRWAAVGTLVVYTAVGSKTVILARAQELPAPPRNSVERMPERRFDIPPGPLETVLPLFERATGLQVNVSDARIGSLMSAGAAGLYTDEQALSKLLAGTGAAYRFLSPKSVIVELRGAHTAIEVIGENGEPALAKLTAPELDTPQTISSASRELLEQQGATTLRDALRNIAGISLAAGEGGAQGDNLTVRGFAARNDIFNDGMRDFGSYYRDPFNVEEVDVLKGPSSVLFGRGSTGGVVNQVTKKPAPSRMIGGALQTGTDETKRATADLNLPVSALGAGSAFRLNVMGHESRQAGRDVAEYRRFGFAPSLGVNAGDRTRLTFSYFHQSADDVPDYGIPWLFDGPAPVDRDNYYGFRSNYLKTSVDIGSLRVERELQSGSSLRNLFRYANYSRDVQITEGRAAGAVSLSTPLEDITVNRNQIAVRSAETFLDNQFDFTAPFRTGFVRHTVVAGFEAGRETSDPTRFTFTGVPATGLLHPDENEPFAGWSSIRSRVNTAAVSFGAYLLDTMALGESWQFTAGARRDRFGADYRDFVSQTAFSRVDRMASWRAALVYKPAGNGSVYFSYGTSFNPSAESLSLNAANANAAPEKNRSFELGSKWDLASGRFSLRAAAFRIEKTNAREPDPNNPLLTVLSGEQRVDGLEIEANGQVTNRWHVLANHALLDSELTQSLAYPKSVGLALANTPRNTFSLWSTHDLPWRLEIGAGAVFVGSRTPSTTSPFDPVTGNLRRAPGYWVFNAMAGYPLTREVHLQVNVDNIADRYYYDQLHPGHIVPGPARRVLAGLRFNF